MSETHFEVIVIGAGVAGIYQIKRLVDLGVHATVLEADPDLGGTWYNNRYPGSRFDSESYSYGYSFSRDVLDEWHWKEHFSSQPENLRYLNFVADKFDLRRHMQFGCRVDAAHYDEPANLWRVRVADGRTLTCRFLVTVLGLLSIPTLPRLPGMDDFRGPSFHTFHWPHEPVALAGKRVGIIGTGATAIQVIGEIADKVGELTVFQRRPNWCAPLNNRPISPAEMAGIRARYDEIFATCARTPGGFVHEPDRRGFQEVPREERLALWDRLYDEQGFGIWLQNFREIFTDEDANEEFSAYVADRIRERVKDPATAEKLIPRDHGFGVQRVPLETELPRSLQPRQRASRGHQRNADRARHRIGPSHHRARPTSWTSSSTRPGSTPSPAPTIASTSAESAANGSARSGATARRPSSACSCTGSRTC